MRVRRRYQDGGRTADLLAALERRRVTNQLNSDLPDRMPQPSAAPASSTRVAMQPPIYTSAEEAMLDQAAGDYVGFSKTFGEPMQQSDVDFLREDPMLPASYYGRVDSSMPLVEFLSPVGDLMAMGEADSGLEFAMAAGLAFVPGNLNIVKEFLPSFVRPNQIKSLENILNAVDDASAGADELISLNVPEVTRMSAEARKEMANGLDEMAEGLMEFPAFSREEVNRLRETSRYLRSPDIKQTSRAAAKSQRHLGPRLGISK